jgi:hypothetical protein
MLFLIPLPRDGAASRKGITVRDREDLRYVWVPLRENDRGRRDLFDRFYR